MASRESFDSNAVEVNGIRMEIMVPDLVALPIPENKPGANTPVELSIRITNNTPTPFRFSPYGTLIPKLVVPDGQVLERQEPRSRQLLTEFDSFLVPQGLPHVVCLNVKLSWQNNKLQLKVPNVPIEPDNSWTFDDLEPGTYRLQFTYHSESGEGIRSERLATQFVNLNLVQPVEFDRRTVEVDGIRFETLVPEQVLTVPANQPNAHTPVWFGIRVTNLSPNPYRFLFFYLLPELMEANGQEIRQDYARNATRYPETSDFPLVEPGKSFTFLLEGKFYWYDNKLILNGRDRSGGFWSFFNLRPSIYQVRFTYENQEARKELRGSRGIVEGLWTGMVSTPFVEFHLANTKLYR